ncbi:putative bifunctional diguanylate cyclase/phosphodiesterase [Novosphingobium sp. Rr 2-17]|uniref:putative bifunctional diguanylate cyclase/phosphodiesterase n=1 Tax=Novosphingobium sp. Rr 2-17 TaxID=555793 RepID=UPI0003046EFA|nr:EAL domain-containing protein [Novosphingobium sp. Rr 2-17]
MLEAVIERLPIGVALLEMDGTPILLNRTFRELHGIREGDEGRNFEQAIADGWMDDFKDDPRLLFKRMRQAIMSGREFVEELEIGDRTILVHDVPVDGNFILTTHQDISSRVAAERRIDHLAHHDALTDVPNRAAFSQRIDRTLANARVMQNKFAVLSIDLDRFKDVNDIFGHGAGDALLRELAVRFRNAADDGFLARLGGDEFSIICDQGEQPEAAASLADQLFAAVADEVEIDGQALVANLSIGIAIYPDDGEDATTLLSNADAALYRAKNEGRGTTRFYEAAMDKKIHEQRVLQQDLRFAVSRDELLLCYQPQATVSGEITGFEALVRWQHPERGTIGPDVFIPLAEQSGVILEMGEWILREACAEAALWAKPLQIAVNLSPIQFRHGDLALLVHEILLETGLSPKRLEIEITESVLIEDFSRAIGILRRIKAMGVRIAMDDFGTGYSSLSYLQSFPFDKLKIDQSFISRLSNSNHAQEIVRAVIGLGRGLNLPIVAEGVETPAQLSFLLDEHCFGVQGYLIGRPEMIDIYASMTGKAVDSGRRQAEG